MKHLKFIAAGLCLLAAGLLFLGIGAPRMPASAYSSADFKISDYGVTMTVFRDRTVEVEEILEVTYLRDCHGIIRDLPIDKGVRYQNIKALRDGKSFSSHSENDAANLLSIYLGSRLDPVDRGETHTYTLTYTMLVPALEEEGYLPLDVLGQDWQAEIDAFSATVSFPEGLASYKVHRGSSILEKDYFEERSGNTITLGAVSLGANAGITLDLVFEAGVLTSSPADLTPLWVVLAGLGVFALMMLLKTFVCGSAVITHTVNFTAPDEMDPLKMGNIIDNKVDSEDLGALIFWFAAGGYLTIDASEDKDDPKLISTGKPLPDDMPAHLVQYYRGVFALGTTVRMNDFINTFYRTADVVKRQVKDASGELYTRRSRTISVLCGILAVLLTGGLLTLLAMLSVGQFYFYWSPIAFCAVSCALSASCLSIVTMRRYKWKLAKRIFCSLGGLLLGLVPMFFLWYFAGECAAFGKLAIYLGIAVSDLLGAYAGSMIARTDAYSAKLGEILGFKDFLVFTEKDRIEALLEEQPELFYRLLPYAQVLGVTEKWTEKFEGIDLAPPTYYSCSDAVFSAVVWNSLFRSMNVRMGTAMTSRPNNHGGGYSGSSGGGHVGGGFGGGGGRSF